MLALLTQIIGELGNCRGFTGALQANEHDDGGRRASVVEPGFAVDAAQHFDEFFMNDFDDLLSGREAFQYLGANGAFLDASNKLLDHLEADIGLQERLTHLAHGLVYVTFGESSFAAQALKHRIQPGGETFEHESDLHLVQQGADCLTYECPRQEAHSCFRVWLPLQHVERADARVQEHYITSGETRGQSKITGQIAKKSTCTGGRVMLSSVVGER